MGRRFHAPDCNLQSAICNLHLELPVLSFLSLSLLLCTVSYIQQVPVPCRQTAYFAAALQLWWTLQHSFGGATQRTDILFFLFFAR